MGSGSANVWEPLGSVAVANAAAVNYTPPWTGAVTRTAQDKFEEAVSLLDFAGVIEGDNAANAASNGVAINNAIQYCKDNDLSLYAPDGVFWSDKAFFTGVTLSEEAAGKKGLKGFFGGSVDTTIFKFNTSGVPCFENTGGRYQEFHSFTIEGSVTNPPNIGLLLARVDRDTGAGNAPSASEGWMHDIEIRGYFTVAAYYNYGAESTRLDRVTYENRLTSGTATIILTDTNVESITSPNSQIAGTITNRQQSSIWHEFTGCQIFDYTASLATDSGVHISGCKSVHFLNTPNYSMFNGINGTAFFELDQDTGNSGLIPQGIKINDNFYHESLGQVAVHLKSSVLGFTHTGNRGANGATGGIVCDTGIDILGEIGAGEHNIIECDVFDGSAADVDVLGYTDVYVNTAFSISDFFHGNVYIPDGGATVTITVPANFKGAVYYEDGTEYRPNQGWSKAHNTSNVTNATGDNTEYTVLWATEIKNTQNEMISPTFTAKYTGRYLVAGSVKLGNMAADTYELVTLKVRTSNRDYVFTQSGLTFDSNNQLTIPFTCIADMEATDTMTITVIVAGGTKSVTVEGSASTAQTWLDVAYLG